MPNYLAAHSFSHYAWIGCNKYRNDARWLLLRQSSCAWMFSVTGCGHPLRLLSSHGAPIDPLSRKNIHAVVVWVTESGDQFPTFSGHTVAVQFSVPPTALLRFNFFKLLLIFFSRKENHFPSSTPFAMWDVYFGCDNPFCFRPLRPH